MQYQFKFRDVILYTPLQKPRQKEEGAVRLVLAHRLTVVCQPVRVDTSRDAAAIAAYVRHMSEA